MELTSTLFTLQRFGPSPSPNFKKQILLKRIALFICDFFSLSEAFFMEKNCLFVQKKVRKRLFDIFPIKKVKIKIALL